MIITFNKRNLFKTNEKLTDFFIPINYKEWKAVLDHEGKEMYINFPSQKILHAGCFDNIYQFKVSKYEDER